MKLAIELNGVNEKGFPFFSVQVVEDQRPVAGMSFLDQNQSIPVKFTMIADVVEKWARLKAETGHYYGDLESMDAPEPQERK